jgi:hypothetical protein
LIKKIPEVSPMVVTLASVSCAKFNSEEYIVTSGPTNHLDLLIRSEIVIATTLSELNRVVHHSAPMVLVDLSFVALYQAI